MTGPTQPGPAPPEPRQGALRRAVVIANPQGLHMRPSAAFVELASRYQADITVHHDGRTVNGKSLWELLLLAALPGSEMEIEASGPDAHEALVALAELMARVPPPDA